MRRLGARVVILVAGAAVLAGCSRKTEGDFRPNADRARAALEKGLRAWQEGQKPGDLQGVSKPAITVNDQDWRDGRKLLEFEILKDEPATDGTSARVFTVRIKTDKDAPGETKYWVVGIDPILIYRDADWQRQSGMSK